LRIASQKGRGEAREVEEGKPVDWSSHWIARHRRQDGKSLSKNQERNCPVAIDRRTKAKRAYTHKEFKKKKRESHLTIRLKENPRPLGLETGLDVPARCPHGSGEKSKKRGKSRREKNCDRRLLPPTRECETREKRRKKSSGSPDFSIHPGDDLEESLLLITEKK